VFLVAAVGLMKMISASTQKLSFSHVGIKITAVALGFLDAVGTRMIAIHIFLLVFH